MRQNRSLLGLAAMSLASTAFAVSEDGPPPREPKPEPKTVAPKGHQHSREIARRLRQQARAAAKRGASPNPSPDLPTTGDLE